MNINGFQLNSYTSTRHKLAKGYTKPSTKKNNTISVEEMDERVRVQNNTQGKVKIIKEKLDLGGKLSASELEYLSKTSPDLYNLAVEAQIEREAYRKELENCKSKKEVESLKSAKSIMFISKIKSANKKGVDSNQIQKISTTFNTILNEHENYVETDKYKNLPSKTTK